MANKKAIVFGSNGMLGQRLTEYILSLNYEIICSSAEEESFIKNVDYKQADISSKQDVKAVFNGFKPDFVFNAAAYTNVDKCESERELAWKINVTGVNNIIYGARLAKAHMVHISTDYVFDGANGPYYEEDPVNPVSYYGRTKLASENEFKLSGISYSVLRTNVLYGNARYGRPDFVKWVVTSLKEGKEIKIVTDQFNNPTYLDDLARAMVLASEGKHQGIYHIGGAEFLNRYEFTLRIADYFQLDEKLIKPILTSDLNQPASRPLKSGLITTKARSEMGYNPTNMDETFKLMKAELNL